MYHEFSTQGLTAMEDSTCRSIHTVDSAHSLLQMRSRVGLTYLFGFEWSSYTPNGSYEAIQ